MGKGPGTCSRIAALFLMTGLTSYVRLPFTFPQPMDAAAAAVFLTQTPSLPLQQRLAVWWTYSLSCSMVGPSTSLLRTRLGVRKPLPPAGAPNLSRYEMEFEQPQCVSLIFKNSRPLAQRLHSISTWTVQQPQFEAEIPFGGGSGVLAFSWFQHKWLFTCFFLIHLAVLDYFWEEDGIMWLYTAIFKSKVLY